MEVGWYRLHHGDKIALAEGDLPRQIQMMMTTGTETVEQTSGYEQAGDGSQQ